MQENFELAIDNAVNALGQRIAELAVTDVEYREGLQFAIDQLAFALGASEELSAIEDEQKDSDEDEDWNDNYGNDIIPSELF